MGTVELKSNLHKIVDEIQSEQLLQTLYDFLKLRKEEVSGNLWESLTDQQKNEVLISFQESEDESNLIPASKIFRNLK